MFTETQKMIYESCIERIIGRLKQYFKPYTENLFCAKCPPMDMPENYVNYNLLMLLLDSALKVDKSNITALCRAIYPERNDIEILFRNINGLSHATLKEHNFLQQICNVSIMKVGNDAPSKQDLAEHFASKLKSDLSDWYNNQNQAQPIHQLYTTAITERCTNNGICFNEIQHDEAIGNSLKV